MVVEERHLKRINRFKPRRRITSPAVFFGRPDRGCRHLDLHRHDPRDSASIPRGVEPMENLSWECAQHVPVVVTHIDNFTYTAMTQHM
jgi:hypothetical protein